MGAEGLAQSALAVREAAHDDRESSAGMGTVHAEGGNGASESVGETGSLAQQAEPHAHPAPNVAKSDTEFAGAEALPMQKTETPSVSSNVGTKVAPTEAVAFDSAVG